MSVADACLVRLTEILPDPLLLTTDSDFKIYRRLGRRVIPVRMPLESAEVLDGSRSEDDPELVKKLRKRADGA